ncbi:MAG: hypothetical protein RLZ55_504 [Actinomycetota bacterium]|jgi:hypothetical protein
MHLRGRVHLFDDRFSHYSVTRRDTRDVCRGGPWTAWGPGGADAPLSESERAELARLRAENAELRMRP